MSDKVDYLDEDPVITTQKYCVISVLTPKNFVDIDNKSTMYTFKVRGSYETVEEAQKRIQYLNSIDANVNIYLAEVGKWCPFEDDPEKAKDAVYKDEELNRLMKGYKENQEKAKELFEVRKAEMVAKALADTKEKKEKLKKEDEEERSKVKIEDSIADKEKEVKEKEEKVVEGKKEIEQKKEVIQSKEEKIRKLNDEMAIAKKKYEELMAKTTVNKSATVV
jgi:chromosome segregation ATPase